MYSAWQVYDEFIDGDHYIQHASNVGDGTARMKARVSQVERLGAAPVLIPRRYIAEGDFVLCLVQARTQPPSANYDLFRVENGKIREHWHVLSVIPPQNEWKNTNGPFKDHLEEYEPIKATLGRVQ